MEIKALHTDDTYTHIALIGKLDVGSVNEIENKFLGYTSARKKNTLVDISEVTFLGSMGLRIILDAAKSLAREKKQLILLNPQPLVAEVLEASGISELVSIQTDSAAALAMVKA
jgi:anti-sigma B factor antagonist